MNMIEFYKSALTAGGFGTVESGGVMDHLLDPPMPAIVNKKPLMLPLNELIASQNASNYIFFHPLRENYMRGPSDVLDYYRKHATLEIESKLMCLIIGLLRLCASTDKHPELNPDQATLLRHAQKANEDTVKQFNNLVEKIFAQNKEHRLVHMYIRKSLRLGDKSYKQGTTVTFPLYETLGEKPGKILGATVNVNSTKCIREVMEYIFPNIGTEHAYSYGSDSIDAPKFEAVLGGIYNVASQINRVIEVMQGVIVGLEPINLDYAQLLGKTETIANEIRAIPVLEGNEGSDDKISSAGAPIQTPGKPVMAQPAQINTPTAGLIPVQPTPAPVAAPVAPVQPVQQPIVAQPIQAQQPVQQPASSAPQPTQLGQALASSGMNNINPYAMGMPLPAGHQMQMVIGPNGMPMMTPVSQQELNQLVQTPYGQMTLGQWNQMQQQHLQQQQMQMQMQMGRPGMIQLGQPNMMGNPMYPGMYGQPALQPPSPYR